MKDDEAPLNLQTLQTELQLAMEEHEEATAEESAARSRVTAATNRLNAAQKALDAALEKLRSKAPRNTDWHMKRNPPRGCVSVDWAIRDRIREYLTAFH